MFGYICLPCSKSEHEDCIPQTRIPPPPSMGGGICICHAQNHKINRDNPWIKELLSRPMTSHEINQI